MILVSKHSSKIKQLLRVCLTACSFLYKYSMSQKNYTQLFSPQTTRHSISFWFEAVTNNWKCYLVWSHVTTFDVTVFNYYTTPSAPWKVQLQSFPDRLVVVWKDSHTLIYWSHAVSFGMQIKSDHLIRQVVRSNF
jgi:hypothetical protein